jgi:anti-sigma regulatory factor (Ser/Thr protein kinase)
MSQRESNSNAASRQLQGGNAVHQAVVLARSFGEAQRLRDDNIARLCIVIEELVTNLYEHGELTDDDNVDLSLAREPDGIRIIITDPGKPFDPRSATPKLDRPERGGGAGLDIIRSWARAIDYAVTSDGNRLELVLPHWRSPRVES